jgi:hypothetical protein
VDELYGDFRNPGKPGATLSMRVSLTGADKSVFQQKYSKHSSLQQNTATAVVAGWNQALGQVLGDMTSDLAGVCKNGANPQCCQPPQKKPKAHDHKK